MSKTPQKSKTKKLAGSKDIIPGISSYCDQWCERCPFTSRCSAFLMDKTLKIDPRDEMDENLDFFGQVSNLLEVAKRMIREKAQQSGIDTKGESLVLENEAGYRVEDDFLGLPEIIKETQNYSMSVLGWLEKNSGLIDGKLQVYKVTTPEDADKLFDALEVIRWYCLLINTKVKQAYVEMIMGYKSKLKNYRGSAKMAIISMDRSITSWTTLYELVPEFEDDILIFLRQLSKFRTTTVNSYPGAMSFVRPGLDE